MNRITRMLTTKEVQEDLGVSPIHLRHMVELGYLNPIRLGKGFRFSQQEILDFQEKYKGKDLSNLEKLIAYKSN